MKHIDEWEQKGGNQSRDQGVERGQRHSTLTESALQCSYCKQVCTSKGGLAIHIKRIHEKSSQRVIFSCKRCNLNFDQEANFKNHQKACTGIEATRPGYKKCAICMKECKTANFARNHRRCRETTAVEHGPVRARVHKPGVAECDQCGAVLQKTNLSRHKKSSCPARRV